MNYYRVTVQIGQQNGENVKYEIERNFKTDKDIYIFAKGFAHGCAIAINGTILEQQIEELNDDRT